MKLSLTTEQMAALQHCRRTLAELGLYVSNGLKIDPATTDKIRQLETNRITKYVLQRVIQADNAILDLLMHDLENK